MPSRRTTLAPSCVSFTRRFSRIEFSAKSGVLQWQRELRDKFREQFEVVRGDTLRANYGMNPWQERDQVVTSVSWVSRIEDARESLLRSDGASSSSTRPTR
jgi:hypothetical protein